MFHRIVIVGGDGTYSHCLNGLLRRVAKDAGVDVNDTQVPPVKAPLPIGVIPSGLWRYVHWQSGSRDFNRHFNWIDTKKVNHKINPKSAELRI